MTQSKATYFSTATQVQFPADQFGVLDVDASYTTVPGDKFFVGEKITGGTSGVTARVSGFISATKIRVKGIKPGTSALIFAQGETVTGNKSTATAAVGAATLVLAQQRKRDIGSGTPTLVFENRASITDRGFETLYWNPVTNADGRTKIAPGKNPLKYTSVVTAIRTAASKAQNTDTSVGPTLTYFGPAATSGTAPIVVWSAAAKPTFAFHVQSSEVFTMTGGAPRISFSFNAAGASSTKVALTGETIAVANPTATSGDLTGITSTVGMVVGQRISVATGGTNILNAIISDVIDATSISITTTGTPSGTVTALSTSNLVSGTGAAATATWVFAVAPGYRVDQRITIAGMTTGGFNEAAAVVTNVSADGKTVYVGNATVGACTIGPGTIVLDALQYAYLDEAGSTNRDLYFNYEFGGGEAAGAMSNTTAYVANGATFTDVGGGTFVLAPNGAWSPALSGVTVVA